MATRSTTMTRSTSGDNLKEKRGTSPSNSHTPKKTITRSASGKEKSSSSSSTAEKHIPNYLKPTISLSSRHDQSLKLNNVKQSSSGLTTEDQKLLRRRSFDKPPSFSPRVQKALISPPARPRDRSTAPLVPKERAGTIRSSSFSGRSNTTSTVSSRPLLDRSATSLSSKLSLDSRSGCAPRTPKAVKPQPVFTSRTTKKNAKTKDYNASPSSSSSSKTLNQEDRQEEEEKECQNREIVEDKVEGDVVDVHDDHNDVIPQLENNEEDHDHENEKVVEDKTSEVSTVSEDENVVNQAAHVEETEEKSHEEEKIEENLKEIDVVVVEGDDHHDDGHDHQHEEITQRGEEKGEETSDEHETGDENKVEEKAVEGGVDQGGGEEVAKQEVGNGNSAASTTHKRAGGQGKKESPTAYNDVIEETAGRLLEKRKNKVKALVGAFETVIDYESGASK